MSPPLSPRARLLAALAAVPLLGAFRLPLWRIDLEAPQYPEGIGMLIRLHTVSGVKEQDLDNINGLNHYIGMKAIVPHAIPELRYMPWIVGALAVGALLVALTRRRSALVAWLVAFVALGVAGLADFWRWGYDYGHDLAPDAIIKIPGMAYQPPVIGSRQLLNFTAHSWPAAGAWCLGLSVALGVAAFAVAVRDAGGALARPASSTFRLAAFLPLAVLLGCSRPGPRPIAYGQEHCGYCRMTVDDRRYAAEAITSTGKVHTFDSIECLAAYVGGGGAARGAWVSDVTRPGTLVSVDSARFWRLGAGGSPMGKGLVATVAGTPPTAGAQGPMDWAAVRALVAREGLRDEPAHGGEHAR